MASGDRILITATVAGVEKKLLALSTTRDGTVILFPARAPDAVHGFPGSNGKKIIQQRYSIHPSRGSDEGVNHIKQTFQVVGMKKDDFFRTDLLTPTIKKGGVQPIFGRLLPDLSPSRYDCRPRGTDIVVPLFLIEPGFFTPVIIVSVSDQNSSGPLPSSRYRTTFVEMSSFRIWVSWTFMPIRPFPQGEFASLVSSTPTLHSEKEPSQLFILDALSVEDTKEVYTQLLRNLHEVAERYLREAFDDPNHPLLGAYLQLMRQVGPFPLAPREFAREVANIANRSNLDLSVFKKMM